MAASGDVLEDVAHDSRVVDHERRSAGEAERAGDAEAFQYLGIRIGEEVDSQIVLRREPAVRFDRILGDSDERCAGLVEVSRPLTELYGFDGSARCVVFRIRPEHDVFAAAEVGEIERPFGSLSGDGDHRFADLDVCAHGMIRRTWKIRSPVSTVVGWPVTGVSAALSTHEPTWSSWIYTCPSYRRVELWRHVVRRTSSPPAAASPISHSPTNGLANDRLT